MARAFYRILDFFNNCNLPFEFQFGSTPCDQRYACKVVEEMKECYIKQDPLTFQAVFARDEITRRNRLVTFTGNITMSFRITPFSIFARSPRQFCVQAPVIALE